MKRQIGKWFVYSVVPGVILWAGSAARAGWFYDFQQPPPATFVIGCDPLSDTFSYDFDDGILTLEDPTPHGDDGAHTAFTYGTQSFADVQVTATINPSGDSDCLLGVYGRSSGGTQYLVGLFNTTGQLGSGRLLLLKKVDGQTVVTEYSMTAVSDFETPYVIQMDVFGDEPAEVSGRLLDLDGAELLSVQYTDADDPILSGVAGTWASTSVLDGDLPLLATFDDAGAVPEPSALLMAAMAALGLLAAGARRATGAPRRR